MVGDRLTAAQGARGLWDAFMSPSLPLTVLAVARVGIVSAPHASNIGIVVTCFEVVLCGTLQIV